MSLIGKLLHRAPSMASMVMIPKPSIVALQGEIEPPNVSVGQVFLPKRNDQQFLSCSSKSFASSFLSPTVCDNPSASCSLAPGGITICSGLANFWREIQGSNNWKNLVEPLDPILRQEIIRYGEFVTACYKAFDLDPSSKRYLNCKFGKKNMLKQVDMENSGYQVTKYIYATPEINIPHIQNDASQGRWIGYVAVSMDEALKKLGRRDVLVSFRGTVTNQEWIANFMSSLTPARLDPHDPRPDVKVESGFLSLYTSDESHKFGLESCREQLLSEVARVINKYKSNGEDLSITLAGHSMGSSLALLLAYDIAELGLNRTSSDREIPVTVFSFGGPRVGNSGFKERCEELGVKVLRIVNVNDPITKLPGVVFNEKFRVLGSFYEWPWSYSCYAHVGVELFLDFFNVQNPACVHDLEAYLSLLKRPKSSGKRRKNYSTLALDLINRTRELISSDQNFANLLNMVNLVQSESSEALAPLLRQFYALFICR